MKKTIYLQEQTIKNNKHSSMKKTQVQNNKTNRTEN